MPIYLDHNATTPVAPPVLQAMLPFFSERFGNPSSIHSYGQQTRRAVDRAREQVADLIGADPGEVVFCGSGTEADNLAIRGPFDRRLAAGVRGGHLVTSAVEHPAVLNPCAGLEERYGARVTRVGVDGAGRVDPDAVAAAIEDETVLVSVMLANNDVGTLQPVAEIAGAARARGVLVHSDAVQALGKVPVRVDELGVDLLSISAHKIHGPKGCGALYVRRGVADRLAPLVLGGAHERGRRAGTENVAGLVGFGAACELAAAGLTRDPPRLAALRDRLERGLLARWPSARVNGHPVERLPNTSSVCLPGVDGEALLMSLDLSGVAVSTGSACSSGTLEPSHVLAAMGIDERLARGAVRFSLGRGNTEEEVDAALDALDRVLAQLTAE